MDWYRNLKVGPKVGLGFGIVECLIVALGILALMQLAKVNGSTVDMGTNWLPSIRFLGELRYDAASVRRFELNHVLDNDKKTEAEDQTNIDKNLAEVAGDEKQYEPLISSDEERHIYEAFRAEWTKYLAVQKRVLELSAQDKKTEARELIENEGRSQFLASMKQIEDDVALNDKGAADAVKFSASAYSSSRYWVIGLLVAAICLGIVLAMSISRAISTSVSAMLGLIDQVASNNLTVDDLEVQSRDEIGQACLAMNKMKNNLRGIVQSMASNAQVVASSSEELSSTSHQMSATAEETST
jgi:methyl-accepting chemotaxis protein